MTVSHSFGFVRAWQTYTIPAGITSVSVDVQGAGSGTRAGGRVTGSFAVSPGQVLYLVVGEAGQPNVGVTGGRAAWGAGAPGGDGYNANGGDSGGGYSCIRVGSSTGTTKAIAGGAGGTSGDGGLGGSAGQAGSRGNAGSGSTTAAGPGNGSGGSGAGGTSSSGPEFAGAAGAGWPNSGGHGGDTGGYDGPGGGGGGGGYGPGGGGCGGSSGYAPGGGGGGGGNYYTPLSSPTSSGTGGGTGNGSIVITHADPNTAPSTPTAIIPGAGTATKSTGTLSASAIVSDPQGGNVRVMFRVSINAAFTTYTDHYSPYVASGTRATATITGLAQDNTYYLRAYAQDPSGLYSPASATTTFFTNRTPTAPTLVGPANGTSFVTTATQLFDWNFNDPDAADIQSYAYFYYRKASDTSYTAVAIPSSTTSYTSPANLFAAGNVYYWAVATRDAGGLWSPVSAERSFTVTGPASAPIPGAPQISAVLDVRTAQVFTWTFSDPDSGDTQSKADFRYRVVGDAAWIDVLNAATTIGSYSLPANTLLKEKEYEWQVRTYDAASNVGPYSASRTFKTRGVPAALTGVTPLDSSSQSTSTPTLTATKAALAAWVPTYIEWQLATNAAFTTGVHTIDQDAATATAAAGTLSLPVGPGDRLPQGTWYLRARQIDGFGVASPWTATQSFTVAHKPTTSGYSPSSSAYVGASTANRLGWTFADTSGTDAQTAYQVIVERNDTGANVFDTGKVVSTGTFHDHNMTAVVKDVLLRWKVRVWDTDDVASDYSPFQLFTLGDAPAITLIPVNNSIVTTGTPHITWTAVMGGTRVQKKWEITFVRTSDGVVIYAASGTQAATRSYTPPVTILQNAQDYSVTLKVTDTSGLSSSITANFHTKYDSPAVVDYIVDNYDLDSTGCIRVTWITTIPDSKFVEWHVYRRIYGAVDWDLISVIPNQNTTSYNDWLFEAGTVYQYSVTQVADRSGELLESTVGFYSRTTLLRQNYAINPSFELDATNWSATFGMTGAGTSGRSTGIGFTGSAFGRITWTAASTARGGGWTYTTVAGSVAPGDTVSASLNVRTSKAQTYDYSIEYYTAAGALISVAGFTTQDYSTPTAWQTYKLENMIAPATTDHIKIKILVSATGVNWAIGDTLDVDGLLIEKVSQLGEFFDGNTPGGHWAGVINESTSYLDSFIYADDDQYLAGSTQYWLIDEDDEAVNLMLPNVTSAPLTDEYEEAVYTLIGRGRKKDSGTRLGYSGQIDCHFRDSDGTAHLRRKQLELMRLNQDVYWLRTPFGDLFKCGLGNITYTPIAGTASVEMLDVSIPFQELS